MSSDGAEGQGAVGTLQKPPLIVDLDCTLLCSDTLVEGIAAGLFQQPLAMAPRLLAAPLSRPRFKAWVFRNINVDYEAIPINESLFAFLQEEKRAGRAIHLVSAADQGVVDKLAERFGIFDSALGSDGAVNLKGENKLKAIRERFGDTFVYVGDSNPDMKIWNKSTGAIYAGTDAGMARRLARRSNGLEADFSRQPATLRTWLKALRLHQWSKNLLLFAPLILAHRYDDMPSVIGALLAFLIMGVAASGTYLINDLSDLSSDRRHRTKRNRPLAAAHVPVWAALVLAPVMIVGGLVAATLLSPRLGLALGAYLVATLAYSLRFKRTAFLDVFILAGLYTLRIVMGTVAIGVAFSLWLLTFTMFFFFSLSLAKRHVEVAAKNQPPGVQIRGRGYFPEDWPLTLSFGVATGAASILILVLYLVDAAYGTNVYKSPAYLGGVPVVIAFWTTRIWLLAHRGQLDDDPVAFAARDRISLMLGGALIVLMAAATFL
jgi:4-hydroxybenzoate polyprenyltransferase